MTDDSAPPSARTTGEHALFWIIWIPFALFTLVLLIGGVSAAGLTLLIPMMIPVAILYFSLIHFLSSDKPFSKVMLLLLGGSLLFYFLVIGGCFLIVLGPSSSFLRGLH